MVLYDQHLHTCYSMDSGTDPGDNVRQALVAGLAGLTFTDHFDTHPTEWPTCEYDYDRLAADVRRLREEFGDRIFIGHGIEICYQPEQMDRILRYLEGRPFDMVLLSVHWFNGRALHEQSHWHSLDTAQATREYLATVLEAVKFVGELSATGCRPFDVLGHLDLVKRYTQRYFGTFDIRAHADLVDEILRCCLSAGLVPEINMSSCRQQLPEPMPADWVVRRYAELGGRSMSIGSDAHQSEYVGVGLVEGSSVMKAQGIHHQAVFKDRQLREVVM
ncbi:MAG: histidinol-phosphatase HisJ family protein [Phycisphaerales bacterium]|nr:histidinol-phosphatase HisJ family protein [Phycisphaerales bacterium]